MVSLVRATLGNLFEAKSATDAATKCLPNDCRSGEVFRMTSAASSVVNQLAAWRPYGA
jgi:hypothetical protein